LYVNVIVKVIFQGHCSNSSIDVNVQGHFQFLTLWPFVKVIY